MRTRSYITLVVATFVVAITSLNCPPQPEPWGPDELTVDVELADDTTRIQQENMDIVVAMDTENHVYTFDTAEAQARGFDLSAGHILIIDGIVIRRITNVTETDDQTTVETEFVPLTDAIENGMISWDYGVEFTPERVTEVEIPEAGIVIDTAKQPINFSITIGEFTYQIEATLATERSDITFTVTKGIGGSAEGRFVVEGFIERFRNKDTIMIQNGELRDFDHQLNGMKGELKLELVVAASGQDFINLELPVVLMKIPIQAGILPATLNIKIQFVINASVPIDGSSRVTTTFNYDSDLGFSSNGVSVSAGGNLGSINFDEGVTETGASGAISANFGVGFPRVELNILGDTLVPWAQTAFLVGGSFTAFPACQTADAEFLGAAGYNLGVLGIPLLSGSVTFFDEKEELLRAGDCPEEKDGMAFVRETLMAPYESDVVLKDY